MSTQTNALGHKYLRLEVPNYDRTVGDSEQPASFLQLGAFPAAVDDPGNDLLKQAGLLTQAGLATDKLFKDDWRYVNGFKHPQTEYRRDDGRAASYSAAPQQSPTDQTSKLLERGGWRLHSDGNYVSTTRGDRVDVIFGNYKMVVYGRQDVTTAGTIWGETYWESSGGHTRWATNTQGDTVLVEWNADRGTWRTYEETIKGDSIERFQGIVDEVTEARTLESYSGCRDAQVGQQIPPSTVSSSTGPHTQTDQATKWINPATGPGGTATSPVPSQGRPRTKQQPDIEETVLARDIVEKTKVTSGMGAAGTDAFSDIAKPTTTNVSSPGATTTKELPEIINEAFGEYEPSIRKAPGGWKSPTVAAGTINSQSRVKTSAYESISAGTHAGKLSVGSGVTVNSQTGLRPALDPGSGDVTDESKSHRIDHLTTVSFAFGKLGESIYGSTKERNYGGWTFNLDLVARTAEISIGATLEQPNFGKGLRHQIALKWADTVEVGISLLAVDVKLGLFAKVILVEKKEISLGPQTTLELTTFKTTLKKTIAMLLKNKASAVDLNVIGQGKEA